jgi:hypothetical protein
VIKKVSIEQIEEVKETDIDKALFEQIPAPLETWMKHAIRAEEEALERDALYEEGLQAFIDPWQDWTRQEERLLEQHVGFGLLPEEVNHDKGDWPRIKKITGTLIIEKVEGFYLSHLESDNPYFAIAYPKRSNPDREQLLHDNRVVRKHVDQISTYMGNPTYGQTKDRCIYTDIYGHINNEFVHIRTTDNVNNIECAMIHTSKGTVKVVSVYNGYIGQLDMDTINNMTTIPVRTMTITAMFDNEGNALPSEYQSKDMNIKGCTIELSYLKHNDCIFDHTRQVQIEEKKANINKFIQARIDSLRKRR